MKKTSNGDGAAKLSMPCPFCDRPAAVKLCAGATPTYYWRCECQARGFFPEAHFRALDRAKKISMN
jgi:hypothetical protein